MPLERKIGIDFGTSTTIVCWQDYEDGRPMSHEPVFLEQKGSRVWPTVLYEHDGDSLFGEDALQEAHRDPQRLVRNFKMDLLSDDTSRVALAERRMQETFRHLYETYQLQKKLPVGVTVEERTFVSYPAKWTDKLRELTKKAAHKAGFKNVEGIDEPTAAMQFFVSFRTHGLEQLLQYEVLRLGQKANVLLIDMGGGTTDLVVYRTSLGRNSGHERCSVWPPSGGISLGGREIDDVLAGFVVEYIQGNFRSREDAEEEARSKADWFGDLIAHKENQISRLLARGEVVRRNDFALLRGLWRNKLRADAAPYEMDRALFEDLAGRHIQEWLHLVAGALRHASEEGVIGSPSDIGLVILTGGHSEWYFAREILSKGKDWKASLPSLKDLLDRDGDLSYVSTLPTIFDARRLLTYADPQTIVARGLVLDVEIGQATEKKEEISHSPGKTNSKKPQLGHNVALKLEVESLTHSDGREKAATPNVKRTWYAYITHAAATRPLKETRAYRGRFDVSESRCLAIRLTAVVADADKPIFDAHTFHFLLDDAADLSSEVRIYLELEIDDLESLTYRGIIFVDGSKQCGAFRQPGRDEWTYTEKQGLLDRLSRLLPVELRLATPG